MIAWIKDICWRILLWSANDLLEDKRWGQKARWGRALALDKLGRKTEASAAYSWCLWNGIREVAAHFALANIKIDSEQYIEAVDHLRCAEQLQPSTELAELIDVWEEYLRQPSEDLRVATLNAAHAVAAG